MSAVSDIGAVFFEDDENRVCKDIPESACRHQPENAAIHLASLAATKAADGLVDPKLVLPWLLQSVGAPAAAIGVLVPLRESLALLPQILVSHRVRALPRRKWVWATGTAIEALTVAAMALVLWRYDGAFAGWLTAVFLAVFALGRSLASVSYKDVLGKTVAKRRRGSVSGLAGSCAAMVTLTYGAALAFGFLPLDRTVLLTGMAVAAGLWALAAFIFLLLAEEPGASQGGADGLAAIMESGRRLWGERQFRLFVIARSFLTVTALAPPYLLLSAGQDGGRSLGSLGSFVVASSLAAILGSTVWGVMSDRSSRWVLILAAIAGALVLGTSAILAVAVSNGVWSMLAPIALFVLMLAYQGVRQGRKIHLVDMAPAEDRTLYTAFSNTAIGVVLIVMGVFGFVADRLGTPFVLAIFCAFCVVAALVAFRLDEVQAD